MRGKASPSAYLHKSLQIIEIDVPYERPYIALIKIGKEQ